MGNQSRLVAKLHVKFQGEEAEDAGGVTKALYRSMSEAMLRHLFAQKQDDDGDEEEHDSGPYLPNADKEPAYFRACGRFLARALLNGRQIGAATKLPNAVYTFITGASLTSEQLYRYSYARAALFLSCSLVVCFPSFVVVVVLHTCSDYEQAASSGTFRNLMGILAITDQVREAMPCAARRPLCVCSFCRSLTCLLLR